MMRVRARTLADRGNLPLRIIGTRVAVLLFPNEAAR
jgi:hypothetical protein